ncbi:MAG: metallophosphoesterase family protein [Thermoguttaceae bacterium]|nr:metallophosphoesterase family protein [Thermoguttaceae bacterium]
MNFRFSFFVFLSLFCASFLSAQTSDRISLIWLSIADENAQTVSVSWASPEPGSSTVFYGPDAECKETAQADGDSVLHHVRIPVGKVVGPDARCFYRVETVTPDGRKFTSGLNSFKTLSTKELRLVFVGNIHTKTISDAAARLDPHVIFLTGDIVPCLHEGGKLNKESARLNVLPFRRLVQNNQALFVSTLLMPCLGNHDREIAPRGERVEGPSQFYDPEATAFRTFFDLPCDEWKWFFDWEPLSLRIVALDLNHTYDFGTSLQTCHDWHRGSDQFEWYDRVSREGGEKRFMVTFQNEQCSAMRNKENGEWHKMFSRGTCMIAGFGHYAERAETSDGMTYFNTSHYGRGDKYADPKKVFCESVDNFLLVTVRPKEFTAGLRDWNTGAPLEASLIRKVGPAAD